MEQQWQPPWQYSWEQNPLPPPPLPYPGSPQPPTAPWEPPLAEPGQGGRRRLWAAVVLLCGAVLLGSLLATCGADGSRPPAGTVLGPPTAGPSPEPTDALPDGDATSGPDEAAALPSPEASPYAPEPSPADSGTAGDAAAGSPAGTGAGPSAAAPRRTTRPKPPARSQSGPAAPARPQSATTPPSLLSSLHVCAEAERLGRWAPGSEQARICRGLYGG
ncbi:hypothetical protein [Kitasatospora camelliae]|uniref:Uncharacterized protein n=1 Tax=Kitasatospora camelliae TaxID=3156397 RepID=A0AAU8JTM1_9ACTN